LTRSRGPRQVRRQFSWDTSDPDFGHDEQGIPFLEAEVIEDCRREPEINLMDREVENLREERAALRIIMKTVSLVEK
jgi:DNA-directed RNA polymerase II subunit RPB1